MKIILFLEKHQIKFLVLYIFFSLINSSYLINDNKFIFNNSLVLLYFYSILIIPLNLIIKNFFPKHIKQRSWNTLITVFLLLINIILILIIVNQLIINWTNTFNFYINILGFLNIVILVFICNLLIFYYYKNFYEFEKLNFVEENNLNENLNA